VAKIERGPQHELGACAGDRAGGGRDRTRVRAIGRDDLPGFCQGDQAGSITVIRGAGEVGQAASDLIGRPPRLGLVALGLKSSNSSPP
jgi:hypothetical protein